MRQMKVFVMRNNWRRRVADRLENALGIKLFKASSRHFWPESDFITRLFEQLKPDCVFDVGANSGQYGIGLRKAGFAGTILSFEPNPATFTQLSQEAENDPLWHVYQNALGAAKQTMPFNVMHNDVLSSFHDPVKSADTHFVGGHNVHKIIDVRVQTLDAVYHKLQETHGFTNPFLKIDTQGFDLEVLKGSTNVLRYFCGLVSEVSLLPIYDGAPTITDSLEAFREAGFLVAEMFNVHPEPVIRQAVELNCYCIARARLP